MRRAAKIDANQPEIVKALRKIGALVTLLSAVGDGVPDLLVWYRGRWTMIEVKDGSKPPCERRLTDDQVRWHAIHAGARVFVVNNVQEAIDAISKVDKG